MNIQIIYLVRDSNCDQIEHKILNIYSPLNTSDTEIISRIINSLEKHESKPVSFSLHGSLLTIVYVILDGKLLRMEEKPGAPVRALY